MAENTAGAEVKGTVTTGTERRNREKRWNEGGIGTGWETETPHPH